MNLLIWNYDTGGVKKKSDCFIIEQLSVFSNPGLKSEVHVELCSNNLVL
jgi:hypothetical protein